MVQAQLLVTLLEDRRDDDEFVLQIVVTLQALLQHEASRSAVLNTAKVHFPPLLALPCLAGGEEGSHAGPAAGAVLSH